MGEKSVRIAYILWFFLGWLGAHQFYLRRDRHAFFLWATLGGFLGIGWLRDLCYIQTYVDEANEPIESWIQRAEPVIQSTESTAQDSKGQGADITVQGTGGQKPREKPRHSLCRWAAAVSLGYILSVLIYATFWKKDLHSNYQNALAFLSHTFAALGVYIPANEGRQKVALIWCLLGAYVSLPLTVMYGMDSIWYGSLFSSMLSGYKTEWRKRPYEAGLCKRLSVLSILGVIYLALVSTSIYYNATVTTKGETVPLRDAVQHFFKSPAWKETKETIKQIYNYYRHHGWRSIWDEFVSAFDPQGEAHAYEVLGLSSSATLKEIKSAYKALALKHHPDKNKEKDPVKKKEIDEKFMDIQKSYEILSNLKKGRTGKTEL